jgi:ribosomal-protein-serine acetyltransferase
MKKKTINRDFVITDGKVSLRPYRTGDAENLYTAVRESLPELSVWMPWAHPYYSLKESRQWLKGKPGEWKDGIAYDFAILDGGDGTYLGGCAINLIDRENLRANLGYWIRSNRTTQGLATSAALLLARWGFKELGLNRIEIVVATENKRSQRVAEKTGAQREGISRNRIFLYDRTHDAVMFSLVPQDLSPE